MRMFGTPETATAERSCGSCALSDACRDPKKSRKYACSLHVRADDAEHRSADESSTDFLAWMRQLVRKESVLSDPYAVDDSMFDTAPNFYTWCMDPKFLNAEPKPFPWQLEVGVRLFGDACPWCSDKRWYSEIPFDSDPEELPDRLQLRDDGVCPRCRRSILDGIREGREHDVNTYIGVVGQRCVTGETLISVRGQGVVPIERLVAQRVSGVYGWHPLPPDVYVMSDGEFVQATKIYVSPPGEALSRVVADTGASLSGTIDHPLWSGHPSHRSDGWTQIGDLTRRHKLSRHTMYSGNGTSLGFVGVKEIAPAPPAPTYDLHVPGKHSFNTGEFLSHNSGKCVLETELVSTARGMVPIKEVVVGDKVVVSGVHHEVSRVIKTRAKKVRRYTTDWGYSVSVTPEHLVRSPAGWEQADSAKHLLVRAEPSAARASMLDWRRKFQHRWVDRFAAAVSSAPESVAVGLLRRVVREESFSGNWLVLRVAVAPEEFQRALLSLGILCARPRDLVDVVVVQQPWAARYARLVGIGSRTIAYHIVKSRTVSATTVGAAACQNLARMMLQQDVPGLHVHLATKHQAQVLYAGCASGSLTRAEAAKGARLMESIPYKEFFLRRNLVTALREVASATAHWDFVVQRKPEGRATVYDLEVPTARRFVVGGVEVHNSTGTALPLSYHMHRLLKIKNPSEFYGIKRGQVLTTSIVGINYSGAKQNVWDPFLDSISNSPWFQDYNANLDEIAKKRGTEELYRLKDTFLMYRHAGLYMGPSSPSRRSLRGKTRIGSVVDELGHFSEKSQMVNISGLAIWDALANSMMTVRGAFRQRRKDGVKAIPPAMMIGISSPWDVGDPIMVLRKKNLEKRSAYVMLRPTWEANPNLTFEMLDEEIPDKVTLWRDFGCRPPLSESAFIHGHEPLVAAVSGGNSLPAARQKTTLMQGAGGRRSFVGARLTWRWTDETPSVLALDAGRNNNSFAAVVAHLSPDGEVVYDAMFEIRPHTSRPVSYEAAYREVLSQVIPRLGVRIIASDRWQNYATGDRAEADHKVRVLECRLKYGDFVAFRDDLLRGALKIPRPETTFEDILDIGEDESNALLDQPVAQFIRQCVRVVDVPGKTVDKPSTGSDDVFRAAVVAHHTLRLPEVAKFLGSGGGRKKSVGALGAAATASMARAPASTRIGISSNMRAPPAPPEVAAPASTRVYLPGRSK